MSAFIVNQIHDRLYKKNKNWLAIITGQTGSGKSYSALKIALAIDPTFTIDRVAFTPEEFLALLNSGTLKKGMAIVFDEAGVAINPRDWYSFSNKAINYVMQTFRRENLAVIFTTPSFSYIDSAVRKLFHSYIETQSINYKDKVVIAKFMNLQHNPRFDKLYFKYPKVVQNGRIKTMTSVKFRMPPLALRRAYEKKKRDFCGDLNRDLENGLKEKQTRKKTGEIKSIEEHAEVIMSKPQVFIKEWSGRRFVDLDMIMLKCKVGAPTAKKIRAHVRVDLDKKRLLNPAKPKKILQKGRTKKKKK